MISNLVKKYLSLSDKMRRGYKNSLGAASPAWEKTFAAIVPAVPEFIRAIYGEVAGTHKNIADQKYMDFIPGYRLIHIEELECEYHTLLQLLASDDVCEVQIKTIIPLLADYSSCYICYVKTTDNRQSIFHYSPDEGLQKMHNSVELFLETIIAFYHKDVFYLDEDGYLDYDFEKEGLIGAAYNPDIEYWME